MAGGLAHDFNNLLTSIIGNAALAKDILPPDHVASGMMDSVISAGERSAELVRMMLATSGYRTRENESIALDELVSWVLSTHILPKEITVVKRIVVETYNGDRRSLETLLWSLISNAAEAYGGPQGEVRLALLPEVTRNAEPASFEEGDEPDGRALCIIIEDSGCGMGPEVLERAFDPFFSTKFTGRGLGLPAVRGIVRSYAGSFRLFTTPGREPASKSRCRSILTDQKPGPTD